MSFAGHVADMISRLNYNRGKLSSGKERMAHVRQQYKNTLHGAKGTIYTREVSFEELEKIKSDIRKKMQKERQRVLYLSFIFGCTVLGIIIVICLLA